MHVDIRLLGGFEVAVDGAKVPDEVWRRRYAAGLVKLLALQPTRRLLRDQVLDALWPDLLVDEAAPRLHKAAHVLELLGVSRQVSDLPEHDRVLTGLREQLGDNAFERLYAEGARLSLREAVALALSDEPNVAGVRASAASGGPAV
jgi:hypothetical protein